MKHCNNFSSDPIMHQLVQKYPAPNFQDRSDQLYEDLIESIVSQQLSVKAADTIFGRFKELFKPLNKTEAKGWQERKGADQRELACLTSGQDGLNESEGALAGGNLLTGPQESKSVFPSPEQILAKSDDELRSAGLSYQKISYIKSVADAFLSDLIDVQKITTMSDEEVIQALTQIRGVGKWTAEMILIFTLQRPDVFSLGDLGIRNAITKLYGITNQQEMLKLSEKWKPHRSTACWYLWRSLENK